MSETNGIRTSLSLKFFSAFGVLMVIMGAISLFGLRSINSIIEGYSQQIKVGDGFKMDAERFSSGLNRQQAMLLQYVLSGDPAIKQEFQKIGAGIDAVDNDIQTLVEQYVPPEKKADYDAILGDLRSNRKAFVEYADQIFAMVDGGVESTQIKELILSTGQPLVQKVDAGAEAFKEFMGTRAAKRMEMIVGTNNTNRKVQITVLFVSLVIALMIASVLTRSIIIPVRKMTESALSMASGDLTVDIPEYAANDEIGALAKSFRQTIVYLRNLIKEVLNAAETLASASQELSASAEQASNTSSQVALTISQIASGSQHEVSAVDDTTRSVEEVVSAVDNIKALADRFSIITNANAASSESGLKATNDVSSSIGDVTNTVRLAMENVSSLAQKSNEIESVVELISAISEQTNLLALNAAIESARAGEHGRGFAVVAEEVRKLAEKSQQSTKEIASLINGVRVDIDATVAAIQSGEGAVDTTAKLVVEAGAALTEITNSAQEAVHQIDEIINATVSIDSSVAKVQSTMHSIATITEETSASTEEVSAAAEEQNAIIEEITGSSRSLSDMAQGLFTLVHRFRV